MRSLTVALTGAVLTACSAGDIGTPAPVAHGFGWEHPVALTNTVLPVSVPLGAADDVICGHTVREIVTLDTVRIRGDDKPCSSCHAWATAANRQDFCDTKVSAFEALPTASGHDDPLNAKPAVLKDLFADWKARGCPD